MIILLQGKKKNSTNKDGKIKKFYSLFGITRKTAILSADLVILFISSEISCKDHFKDNYPSEVSWQGNNSRRPAGRQLVGRG